jgi:hypothetical protein
MPIRPENKHRYPDNWEALSTQVKTASGYRCVGCGLRQYAVGYREADGAFVPLAGNGPCDAAGSGQRWRDGARLTYSEALEFATAQNDHESPGGGQSYDAEGHHWIVIVLTVGHRDHNPENCAIENLACWCQRCHNRYDVQSRRSGVRERQHERQGDLLAAGSEMSAQSAEEKSS